MNSLLHFPVTNHMDFTNQFKFVITCYIEYLLNVGLSQVFNASNSPLSSKLLKWHRYPVLAFLAYDHHALIVTKGKLGTHPVHL